MPVKSVVKCKKRQRQLRASSFGAHQQCRWETHSDPMCSQQVGKESGLSVSDVRTFRLVAGSGVKPDMSMRLRQAHSNALVIYAALTRNHPAYLEAEAAILVSSPNGQRAFHIRDEAGSRGRRPSCFSLPNLQVSRQSTLFS